MQNALDELRRLTAHAENRRTETGIPRVAMVQGTIPQHELAALYDPMINLILQGSKTMTIGDRTLRYDRPAISSCRSTCRPSARYIRRRRGNRTWP